MTALLVMVAAAGAIAVPVTAVPTTGSPDVDGRLDEAVWQEGEWSAGMHELGRDDPAEPQVRFKLALDARYLYLAASLDEPRMDSLVAQVPAAQRDGKLWNEDCLEFLLDPGSNGEQYYHFIVNANGALYDAWRTDGGDKTWSEWDCGARAAAASAEQSWTVELAVPLADIDHGPGLWRFNLARERYAAGRQELHCVAPTTGFHQPAGFVELELPDLPSRPHNWQITLPYQVALAREDQVLVYRARTQITNRTGRFRFFSLRPIVSDAENHVSPGPEVRAGLDDGQSREYEVAVTAPPLGTVTIRLELVDRRRPGRVLARRHIPAELSYTPIQITLLQPRYRGCIFSTQKMDEIVARVKLGLPEEQLARATLVARVERTDQIAAGGLVDETTIPKPPAEVEVRLAAPTIVGEYRLLVELRGVEDAGQGDLRAEVPLRRLPPAKDEWYVGENNVLYHNGEAFLPFGWFSMGESAFPQAREWGYTAVQQYNAQYWTIEKAREWLDQVAQARLVAIFYPYPDSRWFDKERVAKPLTAEERRALTERVAALADHPGVLGYYLCDEPELVPWLPQRLAEIRQTIADADPYHPCIVLNDTIPGIVKYAEGGDVLMPDPYPCFIKGGVAQQPIEKVGAFTRAVNEATGGLKPAWLTPQAFNYGDYGKQNNRAPTFAELRNMLYQGVVYGAKGFLWYTWSHAANYPSLGLGMPYLAREVADLREAVFAPEVAGSVTAEGAAPEHLHVSARRVGDDWFVFAVSTATQPQEVRLKLSATPAPDRLYAVGEGRILDLRDGAFTDRFDVYDTHVYTTREPLAKREPLATVLAAIQQADGARAKPGNLAFEDRGVSVQVSSRSTYGSTPDRVLDGITDGMVWRDGTSGKWPDWLVLRWPEPVRVGRVVVYSDTIADAQVQVPVGDEVPSEEAAAEDGTWRTVGEVKGATESPLTIAFDPVTTSALRLLVTAGRADAAYVTIWEVEAYEQGP